MGSALGIRKVSAGRLGLSLAQYDAHLAAGEKHCGRCREWHPRTAFGIDRSRGDGLASHCSASKVVAIGRPGKAERRQRAAEGFAWCRDCAAWLPLDSVKGGKCRDHRNAMMRDHYARNADTIRARKTARKRRLEPVPDWWEATRFREFGGLCAYGCTRKAVELDHVWPVVRRGRSEPSNLVPACKTCNCSKKDRDPGPWVRRFAHAFPDQFEELYALTYEHASSLNMDAVFRDLEEVA